MPTLPVRHVSVSIDRSFDVVYGFIAEPSNFPQWASGLGKSFKPVGGPDWSVETPSGRMIVRFSTRNDYGVADHAVIPEGGAPMHNPMRVIVNGDGSEVVFSLFRRPEMSEEEFESDADWVGNDLAALKRLLEG